VVERVSVVTSVGRSIVCHWSGCRRIAVVEVFGTVSIDAFHPRRLLRAAQDRKSLVVGSVGYVVLWHDNHVVLFGFVFVTPVGYATAVAIFLLFL
jgi:hypothetical protein